MPINEEGRNKLIEALKATLEQDSYPEYDQLDFGQFSCGSACCMAGLALFLKLGDEWHETVLTTSSHYFIDECEKAGAELLGLHKSEDYQIFATLSYWPYDLRKKYGQAKSQKERVEVAIEALMRTNEYGEISEKVNSTEENLHAN